MWPEAVERRTARCACGRLSVEVSGAPLRVSVCHCLECQQRTGSAFAVQARFPRAAVRRHGEHTTYVRIGDSGGRMEAAFCPHCGSTVSYTVDAEPELVAIPVGAFADPAFPAPEMSVYEERMHGWLHLDDAMRHAH